MSETMGVANANLFLPSDSEHARAGIKLVTPQLSEMRLRPSAIDATDSLCLSPLYFPLISVSYILILKFLKIFLCQIILCLQNDLVSVCSTTVQITRPTEDLVSAC